MVIATSTLYIYEKKKGLLIDPNFWDETVWKYIECIKACLTTKKAQMQKNLLNKKMDLQQQFSDAKVQLFVQRDSFDFTSSSCKYINGLTSFRFYLTSSFPP